MKNGMKILAGAVVMLAVMGTLTLLVVKYFDVLVRIFDNVKDGISRKKAGLFSDECCDCCDEDEEEDDEEYLEAL